MRRPAMTILRSRVCRPIHYSPPLLQRARMGGLWGRTLHRRCSQTARSAWVGPMMGSSHLIRRACSSSLDLPTPTGLTRNVQLSKKSTTSWAFSTGTSAFLPIDLFSWSSPGSRNFEVSGRRYFSINGGVTNIIDFNQNPNGSFAGWQSAACPQTHPYVQNAFPCAGQNSDISATSPEAHHSRCDRLQSTSDRSTKSW